MVKRKKIINKRKKRKKDCHLYYWSEGTFACLTIQLNVTHTHLLHLKTNKIIVFSVFTCSREWENGLGCIFKLFRDSLVPFSQSKSEFHFLQHCWKKFCLINLDLFQNRGASYSQSPIRKMTVSVKWYEWCHNSDNPRAEQLFCRKIYRK